MGDAEPLRGPGERAGDDVKAHVVVDLTRTPRSMTIHERIKATLCVAGPPQDHRRAGDARSLGDLGVGEALGSKSDDPRALSEGGLDHGRS